MVFSSNIFLFWFLPLALVFYYVMPNLKWKNLSLLLFSLLFYFWGEDELVLLMVLSCLFNYGAGLAIASFNRKKLMLMAGVMVNLGVLSYFKYADFFIQNVNNLLPETASILPLNIALPIGISFFTFQSISYLVDVYRNEVQVQRNPLKLSLYISLFPQLVAGPIVRYHDVAAFLEKRSHSIDLFKSGVIRFVIGLSKKVLIANTMAQVADGIINQDAALISTSDAWIGIIAYSLQIYYDFSGYSDMAIGLGRMFGFQFMENFNLPYISNGIQDFWRRWHISLSTWFRDYLYIPLGGNRHGNGRTLLNLVSIFVLTGLWHGASWSFIFWGLIHGSFLIIERFGLNRWLKRFPVFGHVYTILALLLTWVFFRIENIGEAFGYLKIMLGSQLQIPSSFYLNRLQLTVGLIAIYFAFNGIQLIKRLIPKKLFDPKRTIYDTTVTFGVLVLFGLCIMWLVSSAYNPFIYYRF